MTLFLFALQTLQIRGMRVRWVGFFFFIHGLSCFRLSLRVLSSPTTATSSWTGSLSTLRTGGKSTQRSRWFQVRTSLVTKSGAINHRHIQPPTGTSEKLQRSARCLFLLRCGGDGALRRHGWTSLLRHGGWKRAGSRSSSQLRSLSWSVSRLLLKWPPPLPQVPCSWLAPALRLCWNWSRDVFTHLTTRCKRGSLDFSHPAGGASQSVSFKVPDE